MKKIIVFGCLFCLVSTFHAHAQSINNRNWRTFIADPMNDSLTFHLRSDTSFVTNSTGITLLKTSTTIVGDTLTLSDLGSGEYTCPDKGRYKISLNGNSFTLKLIDDPCDGRARALDGIKWTEVMK